MEMIRAGVVLVAFLLALVPAVQADGDAPLKAEEAQAIPFKQEAVLSEKTLIKAGAVSMLGVFLALAFVILLKKYMGKIPSAAGIEDRIRLAAVKRLSPKLILMIARVDDREYLISQSGDRVTITPHRELKPEEEASDA